MKTCSTCQHSLDETEFFQRGDRPGFLRSQCRTCYRVARKKWETRNPAQTKRLHKFKNVAAKYGISAEDYEAMLREQNGCCATCAKPFVGVVGPASPCVDHNHATGEVRGLLCRHCNFAIGLADENPEILRRMIGYLEDTN